MEYAYSPDTDDRDCRHGSDVESESMLLAEKPSQAKGNLWKRSTCSIVQLVILLLALWGVISLVINAKWWLGISEWQSDAPLSSACFSADKSGPYYPSTLPAGANVCDCGTTIDEALQRDCIYDSLAAAWLPPYCRDDELTSEFDRAGPSETNGEWYYFADEQGTTRLDKEQMGLLGETGGSFWATRDWHISHCLFYWQKYTRVRDTGVIMEERFDSLAHVKHCTHLATKKAPGFFFLIKVAVRMNSSDIRGNIGH